ncbi:EAL domain-containing protein, partial [Geomonas sp.]|uniref:EAL domain-containing protein n=1 Tax=Geomonas sp. TaxID=2651584 RepID=UPI002B497346
VNVSAWQLRGQHLPGMIAQILEETRVKPEYLELEVTESAVMHNVDDAGETLRALKAMGIRISIDDFGTGYSSLANLKSFSIDCLKIDRSFINNVSHSRDDKAIVFAIIAMARSLNLKVVAEGVEKEEQLACLRENGCHEVQGHLFCPPLPPAEFMSFVAGQELLTAPHCLQMAAELLA